MPYSAGRRMKSNQNIIAIALSNTIAVTANGFWIMFMPLFFSDLGLSTLQVSLVFSCSSIAIAGFNPLGGRLADRFGRKIVAVLGRYLTTLGPLSLLIISALYLELNVKICFAIVGYLVLSAGSGLRMPAMSMLLMESSKVERRGRNYMVAERVIPSIPPALSVLIGASLFAANSPRLLFYLGFSGLLISALILHLALHETLHEVEPRISAIPVQRKSSQFGLFFPLLTLAFVLDGMSARAVSWYIPIFLGLENVELYGVLVSVSTLVIAFFGIISGLLVDRVGAKYSLAPSWVLLAITVVVFSQAESFLWILLTYSIWVALDTIDTAVPPVLISECYPKEQRATVSGLFRMVVQSSLFAGPLLAGMAVSLGSVGPFWLKSAMNGLAAVLIVAAFRFQVRSSGGKNVATKQD